MTRIHASPTHRRSHLTAGLKSKSFADRMQKTQRAQAVKKLETELKDEKANELKRRREITLERKKAAEEKQRIEADKAKVRSLASLPCMHAFLLLRVLQYRTQIPALIFSPPLSQLRSGRMELRLTQSPL